MTDPDLLELEKLRRENAELREIIARLREELEKARRDIEEWKRGHRERSKRRSSRAEGASRREAKAPGRKTGHVAARRSVPTHVDREQAHPTPSTCPDCSGVVEETSEELSTLEVDIPPVKPVVTKHTTCVGRCKRCQRRVVARLPGSSANGTTVATVTLGPNVQSLALSLRFDVKGSLARIGSFIGQWFGVPISPGGLTQMFDRLRERSATAIPEIKQALRASPVVGMDETGLRQNGALGWCWIARTAQLSLYQIELSRGRAVAEEILGEDFKGVLVTDFLSVYAHQGRWINAFCGAHVIREAKKIAEVQPCAETEDFRDRVRTFYKAGEAAAASGDASARRGARIRLGHLISSMDYVAYPDIVKLQTRLDTHKAGVTRFIGMPNVPWNNNASERDIRVVARYRAVTGGTRSPRGSATVGHWLSVIHTRRKNGKDLVPFVHAVNHAHRLGQSPPSVFM